MPYMHMKELEASVRDMTSVVPKRFLPGLKGAREGLQSVKSGKLRWPMSCSNMRQTAVNVSVNELRAEDLCCWRVLRAQSTIRKIMAVRCHRRFVLSYSMTPPSRPCLWRPDRPAARLRVVFVDGRRIGLDKPDIRLAGCAACRKCAKKAN